MSNSVCDLLGIKHPVIQGGLAYVGNGELAAAVSNGGGFGVVGSGGRTADDFNKQIKIASRFTNNPLGVNLPISEHSDNKPYIDVVLQNKELIKGISISAGNPKEYIPIFKNAGLVVMVYVGSMKHAKKAEELGADIVICEGFEAGGHNSPLELTTFTLIPQVANAVNIPVVAAGGISNGRGMVAALALGADAIQMGTRFVATQECEAHENYKNYMLKINDAATVIMARSIGNVFRVAKSDFSEQVIEYENKNNPSVSELLPFIKGSVNRKAAIDGELDQGWLNCGQVVGLINSIESATDVVQSIVKEANQVIEELNKIKL